MQCHILKVPPLSGDLPKVQFRAEGTCAWVKFVPEESDPWVGVFGWGALKFRSEAVAILHAAPFAFVIAGGAPYIINYEARTLVWYSDDAWLTGVVAAEAQSLFVACDDIRLYAFTLSGEQRWISRRISWDGIRNLSVVGEGVQGDADYPDGAVATFATDIETGATTGGSYDGPRIFTP